MKLITIFAILCATPVAAKEISTRGCPASIWKKPVSGSLTDKSKYVREIGPSADNVLFLNGMTKAGVISVTVAANKNNKALDVIINDAWLDIEDGADFDITADDEVKECKVKKCVDDHIKRKEPVFSYKLGKFLSCGGTLCAKTCNKFSCDYWGKEEDYSCKSLEEEYGCDCEGCQCNVDHKSCNNKLAKKRCNNKSCDEWIVQSGGSLTCQMLEKDFKCSCSGCGCKAPPKCDAKTKKFCTDAYKEPCTGGKAVCGPCMKGYTTDNKHGCVKLLDCKSLGKATKKAGNAKSQTVCGETLKCKCEGGVAAMGTACPANGALKCIKCDKDRKLVKTGNLGKCVASGTTPKATTPKATTPKATTPKATTPKATTPKATCDGKCGLPSYKGDGNCDDENNNCGCAYDGGDCCGTDVKKAYCQECKCKDPNYKPSKCPGKCGQQNYKGDGNCDDENNNCGCNYDGGDCCGTNVKKTYCQECKCKDPNYKPNTNCPGKCGSQYNGDGNCDDENNNCGCNYDGGDCCAKSVKGGKVNTPYCTECKCKDPKYKVKGCNDVCTAAQYIGDGNCDDGNNNCACGYDKGDCCGTDVKKAYCTECKCKDPNYKPNTNCPGKCGLPSYKGDGNCDDDNNNCGCGYDGGDCCAKSVKGGKVKQTYCKQCKCKDPKYKVKGCNDACTAAQYIGDGNCDDENNNCDCGYDKGDCCGPNVKKTYCKECKCKDPNYKPNTNCPGTCGQQSYKGDGNCDDDNNNCGCGYDGGDCCGASVKKTYCKECKCKDPNYNPNCSGTCGLPNYKGDGNCDDENNNCGCEYDGGDCCGANVKKTYCKACKCKDPKHKKN